MKSRAPLNLAIKAEWFRTLGNRRGLELFVSLVREGPLSQKELANRLAISTAAISHHLTALREVGLTDRSANARGQLLHFVAEDQALEGLILWLTGERRYEKGPEPNESSPEN